MVDFPGCMAGIFFTAGCNFRCPFCHNAELIQGSQQRLSWSALQQTCRNLQRQWVDSVVISGGEPTLHADLPQLIRFFKNNGFHVKLDSNGSNPQMLATVLDQLDYIAIDIKCSLNSYRNWIGFTDTHALVETVALLKQRGGAYELRTTIIDSFHSDAELEQMTPLISGAALYVLQPFLPRPNLPDPALSNQLRTSNERLQQIQQRFAAVVEKVIVRA